MGDKAAAKTTHAQRRRALRARLSTAMSRPRPPCWPRRLAWACPLLVKAIAGGGGRGMRLVRDLAELPEALAGARREAEAAFGDGRLMLERLIDDGRHIEIQIFADTHGQRRCTWASAIAARSAGGRS